MWSKFTLFSCETVNSFALLKFTVCGHLSFLFLFISELFLKQNKINYNIDTTKTSFIKRNNKPTVIA